MSGGASEATAVAPKRKRSDHLRNDEVNNLLRIIREELLPRKRAGYAIGPMQKRICEQFNIVPRTLNFYMREAEGRPKNG